jgi:hypothetical protein
MAAVGEIDHARELAPRLFKLLCNLSVIPKLTTARNFLSTGSRKNLLIYYYIELSKRSWYGS